MFIKKIEIEGIKGFGRGENGVILDLQRPDGSYAGWTVIAGRNGTGKSTFLQTLALTLAGPGAFRSLQESLVHWVNFDGKMARSTVTLQLNDTEKLRSPSYKEYNEISTSFQFFSETENSEPATFWEEQ